MSRGDVIGVVASYVYAFALLSAMAMALASALLHLGI